MEENGIPKLEQGENDPLLDYVVEYADIWWPQCDGYDENGEPDLSCSDVPRMFVYYYTQGEIDTSMESDYLEHQEVQNTLKAFELDRDKFWYFCLMLKDVVRGFTEDATPMAKNPREELEALIIELAKMEPETHQEGVMKGWWKCSKYPAELSLQVKDKEGKKKGSIFTIKSKKTLFYLAVAVYAFLEERPMPAAPLLCDLDSTSYGEEFSLYEKVTEKEIWRVALFNKFLDKFLKRQLEGKTVKRTIEEEITMWSSGKKRKIEIQVDTSREHLISRMIYILHISENEKYDDLKNYSILKNNLKGDYKDPKPTNHNSRYNA